MVESDLESEVQDCLDDLGYTGVTDLRKAEVELQKVCKTQVKLIEEAGKQLINSFPIHENIYF